MRERYPGLGTRERLAFDLLLYTGLRRGDVAQLDRQHVGDGIITLRTAKTGQVVTSPIPPRLADSIAATRASDLAFIAMANGWPMVKEAFRQLVSGGLRRGRRERLAARPAQARRDPHDRQRHSPKRPSGGAEAAWPRSTQDAQTGGDSRSSPWRGWPIKTRVGNPIPAPRNRARSAALDHG